jgi:hypothetical protein
LRRFAATSFLVGAGCTSLDSSRVAPPSVDPQAAAAEAIRLYDTNTDGALDESELRACPAMHSVRNLYDGDGNGQVSEEEIARHIEGIVSSGVSMTEVQCTVTRGGRALADATVRFVPETFLGDAVQPATATTDSEGVATPRIAADQLPEQLRHAPLMQVGIYRVEIEHPQLKATDAKPLGVEVDPTRRDGTTARFDL